MTAGLRFVANLPADSTVTSATVSITGFEAAGTPSLESRSIQAKMQRFLAGRGFAYDTIRTAIDYFLNHP